MLSSTAASRASAIAPHLAIINVAWAQRLQHRVERCHLLTDAPHRVGYTGHTFTAHAVQIRGSWRMKFSEFNAILRVRWRIAIKFWLFRFSLLPYGALCGTQLALRVCMCARVLPFGVCPFNAVRTKLLLLLLLLLCCVPRARCTLFVRFTIDFRTRVGS